MKYTEAIREAAADSIRCLAHPVAWRDLWTGMVAATFILLRAFMLVTFPISVPLAAFVILTDHQRRVARVQAAKARIAGRGVQ